MATQSPFLLLESFLRTLKPGNLPDLTPPAWAIDEAQRRVVLLLNHVLQQEIEATNRISRQKGRVVFIKWRFVAIKIVATPAGLLDLATPDSIPDLTVVLTQESPLAIAQAVLTGNKPGVRIDGDVQLAAEMNWLVDHVRWDVEDDLARVIGGVPAHTLSIAARGLGDALRRFVGNAAPKNHVGGAPT